MIEMLNCYTPIIENALNRLIPNVNPRYSNLRDAMSYSVAAGGKRLRPALTMEFCRVCGGFEQLAVNYACAVEFIHTYSLIHDDLPCLDNDDLRRGKPSCHKVYGEDIALLAGDALQPLAFSAVALAPLKDKQNVRASAILAEYCGINGMVGGQTVDVNSEKRTADHNDIELMHNLKTGALIKAACVLGCIAAEAYDKIPIAEEYSIAIGKAFQIRDDILDVIGNEQQLGKPIGSDVEQNKTTYVTLFGVEQAEKEVERLTQQAIAALEPLGSDGERLKQLALYLSDRKM